MNSFHFRGGGVEVLCFLPSKHYPLYDYDLRATHAYTTARSIGFCVIWVCISSSSPCAHGAGKVTPALLSSYLSNSSSDKRLLMQSAVLSQLSGKTKSGNRTLGRQFNEICKPGRRSRSRAFHFSLSTKLIRISIALTRF